MAYRPFPRGGFDIAHRLRDMDEAGVDVHVLSATPQTYLYNQEAALGAATAAIQNDQIAKLIKENPQRFMGIATLPMQAPEKAADELRRAMTKLGLRGTMIASNIMGKESRRSELRAAVGDRRGAGSLRFRASEQRRRRRPDEVLLS